MFKILREGDARSMAGMTSSFKKSREPSESKTKSLPRLKQT